MASAQNSSDERVSIGAAPRVSLSDRWFAIRNRILESPGFQRFSASFPLTRSIADAQARALFDICAGFVYSQVLVACVRLDLFAKLASGPRTIPELSRDLRLTAAATERLLLAAVSLRLVERRKPNRFGLGMLGAALNGNPGVVAMILHHDMLYRDLEDPVALLRGESQPTNLARYWAYAQCGNPESLGSADVGSYSALMASSQSFLARDVLDAYPFGRHRHLLDIGGGEGAFIAAARERFPGLAVSLFDLPAVAARARTMAIAEGPASSVAILEGNFTSDPLPSGADVVTLNRVVHDHDDMTVMSLLRSIHKLLPAGGTLVIAEPMAGISGAERMGDAYFGMYLLAMGRGRPRSPAQIRAMLESAGFNEISVCKTLRPLLISVISGTRM